MAFLKKYYGVLILSIGLFSYVAYQFYQFYRFEKLYDSPQTRDIYLFSSDQKYSPYQLDKVTEDSLFFFSHPFDFTEAVPAIDKILEDSFNNNIHYIYGRSELDRLVKAQRIIKIYR